MRTSTWRGLLAALTALLLVVAACGDDGDDATTDVVEATDDGDGDSEEGSDGDDGDDGVGDDGGTGDLALSGEFCADIAAAEEFFDSFGAEATALQDPAQISAVMRQAIDTIAGIDAPGAIRDDWSQLIDAVSEIADLFDRIDFSDPQALEDLADDPELMAEFMGLEERFEGLEDAGDRVTDYVRDECGIELD